MSLKARTNCVSVVIVNWNGKKWLKRCLESLLSQTYKDLEIVLVDNASTDGSATFVHEHYPTVRVVTSQQNLGFAGGNNLGIGQAKGEFILLMNNDAYVDSNFLQRIAEGFHQSGSDVVGPREADYRTKTPIMVRKTLIDPWGYPVWVGDNHPKPNFYLTGVCIFFRKSLYTETKGLDENFFMYCEEVDWFWRLKLMNKKITYLNDIFVYHAVSGSTGDGIKYQTFLWRNQNILQMILKNYAWYSLLWVLPLYFAQNVGEMLGLLIVLKPKIALSYLQAWGFNIRHLQTILANRRWVQRHRKLSDRELLTGMYIGVGKIVHMVHFIKLKRYGKAV